MDNKLSAHTRMKSLAAPIESWLTAAEIEAQRRELSIETVFEIAAERREFRRTRRLYAQLRLSGREPPQRSRSAEWQVYRTLLYANSQHRLRLSGLVRRTGLPREQLLAAVRRLRELGYVQFGVETS